MANLKYEDFAKQVGATQNGGVTGNRYADIYDDMVNNAEKYYNAFDNSITRYNSELKRVNFMSNLYSHDVPKQYRRYADLYSQMLSDPDKGISEWGERGYKKELQSVKELFEIESQTSGHIMDLMDKSGVPGWSSIVKKTPELQSHYDYDPTNPDDEYLKEMDYAPSSFLTADKLSEKLKSGYSADYYTKFDAATSDAIDGMDKPKFFKEVLKQSMAAPSFYLSQLYKYDMSDPDDVINMALGLMPNSFKYEKTPEDEARQATGRLPQAAETYVKNSTEFNIAYSSYAQMMQEYVDEKYVTDQTVFPLMDTTPQAPSAPDIVEYVKQYYTSKDAANEQSALKIRDYTTKTGYSKDSEEEIAAPLMYLPYGKLPMSAEDFTPSEDAVKRAQYMNDYVGQHWYNPISMTANAQDYAAAMLEADKQTDVINKLKASGEYDKLAAFESEIETMLSPRGEYTPENYSTVVSNVDWVSGLGLTGGEEELKETMKRALEVAGTEKGTYYDPMANAPITMSRIGAKDRGTLYGNNDDVLRSIRAQLDAAGWNGELQSTDPAISELLKQAEYRTIQLQRQRLNDYYASLKEAPAWVIAIGEGMLQGTSNIGSSLKSINAGLYEIITGDDTASRKVATEQQSEDILRRQTVAAANDGEGFAQTLYDVAQTATEMGIELGAGYLLGAAIPVNEATTVWGKTFSKLVLDPKLYPFAVASLGRNLAQAELEGRTTAEKWTAALPNAYIESVLEQSIGFFSKSNPAGKLLSNGIKGMSMQTLKNAGRMLLENTLGEAIEENVQDIVNLGVRQILYKNYDPKVYGSDIDMTSMWQTTKTTVLVGMLLSLFSVPGGFSSYRSAKQIETHFNNAVEAYTAGDMQKFDAEMRAFNEQFGGAIEALKEDMASGAIERVDEFLATTNQYEPELRNMYDAVQEAAGLRSLQQQGETVPDWMVTQADARANEAISRIRSLKLGTPEQFNTLYDQVMNSEELAKMATGTGLTAELIGQTKAPLTNAQMQVLRDIEQVAETNPYVNIKFDTTTTVEALDKKVQREQEDYSTSEAKFKRYLELAKVELKHAYRTSVKEGQRMNEEIRAELLDFDADVKKTYKKLSEARDIRDAYNAQGGFRKMFEQAANLEQGVQAPVSAVEGDSGAEVQTPSDAATTQASPVAQGKYENVARSIPFEASVTEIVGQVPMSERLQQKQTDDTGRVAGVLTSIKQEKPSKISAIKTSYDFAKRKFVDSGATISTFAKKVNDRLIYPLYNNAKQAKTAAQHMIGVEQFDINGNRTGDSLISILEPINAKGEAYKKEFFTYLLHKHNIGRMEQSKPVFGKSVTAEMSGSKVKEYEAQYPEFVQHANNVYDYNRNLMQWRVDSGLITQETADMLNEMYPYYVPTYRSQATTAGSTAYGYSVSVDGTLKKATGSDRDIMPLDDSMARQTLNVVQAAKRNILGNRLFDAAIDNGAVAGEFIDSVSIEKSDYDVDTEHEDKPELKNAIKIYRNGEAATMKVNSGIFDGFKAISSMAGEYSAIIKGAEKVNTMFKQLITGYNPVFLVRNFARDLQDVGLYTKDGIGFIKNFPRAYQEMLTNGEYWQLYQRFGGIGSSFFDYEKGLSTSKTGAVKKYTIGLIENLNMAVEQAPRLAEFISTIEKGGMSYENIVQATLNAAEVTVNFGRSGTWGKVINSTFVPFFNPSIQGASRLIRRFTETKGVKEWTSLVIRATALGVLPSLINSLIYAGDDEYETINNRDKDRYYLFKMSDGYWAKIPKGRVLSLFGTVANMIAGTENTDFAEFIQLVGEQVAPISPLDSNILSPIMLTMFNTTWYGTPIEGERLQKYAPGQRYDESTDEFSKWLGGVTGWSPKKINYLLDAYTGVIGDFMLPLTTPEAERGGVLAPAVNAFVLDTATTNKLATEFYDKVEDIGYRMNSGDVQKEAAAKAENKVIQKYVSQVSELNKLIRKAENSDKPDDEKLKIVRDLSVTISALQQEALKRLE